MTHFIDDAMERLAEIRRELWMDRSPLARDEIHAAEEAAENALRRFVKPLLRAAAAKKEWAVWVGEFPAHTMAEIENSPDGIWSVEPEQTFIFAEAKRNACKARVARLKSEIESSDQNEWEARGWKIADEKRGWLAHTMTVTAEGITFSVTIMDTTTAHATAPCPRAFEVVPVMICDQDCINWSGSGAYFETFRYVESRGREVAVWEPVPDGEGAIIDRVKRDPRHNGIGIVEKTLPIPKAI
jgi:hypothetical protein